MSVGQTGLGAGPDRSHSWCSVPWYATICSPCNYNHSSLMFSLTAIEWTQAATVEVEKAYNHGNGALRWWRGTVHCPLSYVHNSGSQKTLSDIRTAVNTSNSRGTQSKQSDNMRGTKDDVKACNVVTVSGEMYFRLLRRRETPEIASACFLGIKRK